VLGVQPLLRGFDVAAIFVEGTRPFGELGQESARELGTGNSFRHGWMHVRIITMNKVGTYALERSVEDFEVEKKKKKVATLAPKN
jgi:hypothetical protein